MARPTDLPGTGWATNAGRRTALSSAQWGTGFVVGQPVAAEDVNDPIGQLSDWIKYLQVMSPAEGVWTVVAAGTTYGTLGYYDAGADEYLRLQTSNTMDGVYIEALDNPTTGTIRFTLDSTNAFWSINGDPTGADTIWLKGNASGLIGPTATASATTGIRWGYPSSSKQNQLFAVGPDIGGYTASTASIGSTRPEIFDPGGTGYVGVCNSGSGGAADCTLRRPLTIPEITGQLSGYPVLVEAAAAFTGAADDLEIRICRKELATGTITVLTTLKSSDTSNTIAHTCLPASNMYFVDVVGIGVAGAGVTTDRVRNVILSVDMQAVNTGI